MEGLRWRPLRRGRPCVRDGRRVGRSARLQAAEVPAAEPTEQLGACGVRVAVWV
jgi:hypothetical protein